MRTIFLTFLSKSSETESVIETRLFPLLTSLLLSPQNLKQCLAHSQPLIFVK